MAKAPVPPAGTKDADKAGLLSGLLAEEDEFDRRSLWRIGSWGVAAVGAVVLAVAANQSSLGWRRDQVAAADVARQAQQIQSLTKDSQNETRRLASAIDTLNSDRDRLFARVTVIEQGLDSVTGAIAKQSAAANSVASASSPPKPMPPASAMPMISPPIVAADNAASTTPLAQSQAATAANTAAVAPDKPKEQVKLEQAKLEQIKLEQAKAEQPKPEAAKPDPAAAQTLSLPQTPSNKAAASPSVPPVAAQPPAPIGATKSMMGPPEPGAPRLIETSKEPTKTANAAPTPAAAPAPVSDANAAAAPPKDGEKPELDADAANDADKSTIQRTEFAVELGGANSISGLRALWRGLLKSHDNRAALAELQPIIVLRESNTGLGMQLKLAAGPLHDAAEAAKICAALTESSKRTCETTVFDGQRLAMGSEEAQPATPESKQPATDGRQPATAAGGKSTSYKRYYSRHSKKEDPPPPPPPQQSSTFSSLFGMGKH